MFDIIFCAATVVLMVWLAIFLYQEIYAPLKYKEIAENGKTIRGKIVKLKYLRDRGFLKTRDCYFLVSFETQSKQKILKARPIVYNNNYSVGDEINLLYHEDYPKLVFLAKAPPPTIKKIIPDIILYAVVIVILGVAAYYFFENYKCEQHKRTLTYEFSRRSP
ncbi:MAG: hypothetical protein FWD19_04990 [Defluviitaleaceae bacterium]|nr:hypothetical protein [Defluviitaleaceae bacterium]